MSSSSSQNDKEQATSTKAQDSKVIVALDFPDLKSTLALAEQLDPKLCRVKVGKEIFTQVGPAVVKGLHDLGHQVFLDLKFHDIPNTVANAVAAAADLGVWMVNVHASGGSRMMEAASNKLATCGGDVPLLIAVTVLTSSNQQDLQEIGITCSPAEQVRRLARLAQTSGLDGVVCSAQEASILKADLGTEFKLVTPGIRPSGSDPGDQRRICTPRDAVSNGVDYLVIGRPITQAASPLAMLASIADEIAGANRS